MKWGVAAAMGVKNSQAPSASIPGMSLRIHDSIISENGSMVNKKEAEASLLVCVVVPCEDVIRFALHLIDGLCLKVPSLVLVVVCNLVGKHRSVGDVAA